MASPIVGCIHMNQLFVCMVKHELARMNAAYAKVEFFENGFDILVFFLAKFA